MLKVKWLIGMTLFLGLSSACLAEETTETSLTKITKVMGEFHKIERKNEADVIINSVDEAAKQIFSLKGLREGKKVGVLVVRETSTRDRSFGPSGARIDIWDYIPIVNVLRKKESTIWSAANLSQGETGISHSPLIEELIIKELVKSGKFELVETLPIQPYYGLIDKVNSGALELIRRETGCDVLILGSAGGSILKKVKRTLYLWEEEVFVSNVKLTLRTVDTKTGEITSSDVFTGSDSVVTFKRTRIPELLYAIGVGVPVSIAILGSIF